MYAYVYVTKSKIFCCLEEKLMTKISNCMILVQVDLATNGTVFVFASTWLLYEDGCNNQLALCQHVYTKTVKASDSSPL